jgi:diketogulonate reductase-like aldo/keto reductase
VVLSGRWKGHRSTPLPSAHDFSVMQQSRMQYVRLGSSGLRVSRIALGMMSYGSQTERRWHLREDETEPIVRRAVEAGVTLFDTADMYSDGLTEEINETRSS